MAERIHDMRKLGKIEVKMATHAAKSRNLGLDVTRTIAISLVIFIHAIGFSIDGYSIPIMGVDGFIRIYLRRICFSCVPLFLMLSGFLNGRKTDPVKVWKKSFPHIGLSYLFWSTLIVLYNALCLGEVFSLNTILNVFTYALPRAWYINMYMGLLVLMPFINKCWGDSDKKEKRLLLTALFLISIVSKYVSTVSMNRFSSTSLMLISSYFFNSFYIFYYLVGSYVHDYPVHIEKRRIIILWQLVLCIHTGYYYLAGWGGYYNDIPGAASFWYDNPVLAFESILLFLICYNIETENKLLRKAVSALSIVAFDVYLVSYIFDMLAYRHFSFLYFRYPYYLVLFGCFTFSFCCSFISASIKRYLARKIQSIVKKAVEKNEGKYT